VVTFYNPDNRVAQQDVKGARPAVLPMEQSTGLEVMLDLKTAKTVVLRIPPSLLVCPDKVIQ
jgi:putative tryptophan/tyrosine transport system substrate-binding protein